MGIQYKAVRRLLMRFPRAAPTDVPVLILLNAAGIGLIVSPLPQRSLSAMVPLIMGVLLYQIIGRRRWTEEQLEWAWWALILAAMLASLYVALAMDPRPTTLLPAMHSLLVSWRNLLMTLGLQVPITVHHNVAASVIATLAPFAVVRWLMILRGMRSGTPREHWSVASISLLSLSMLILSQSRGGYLAFLASLLIILWAYWRKIARGLIVMLSIGAFAATCIWGWADVVVLVTGSGGLTGLEFRLYAWSLALDAVRDFSFTGVGYGCYGPVVTALYPTPMAFPDGWPHAHSLFLQVAVDLGIPGLAAYVTITGLTLALMLRSKRMMWDRAQGRLAALATACAASQVGMITHGLIDAVAWISKTGFLPWIIMGLGVALYLYACSEMAACHEGR